MRRVLARALGVLLGAFGLAALWNGIGEMPYARAFDEHAVVWLHIVGGPAAVIGGY